MISPAGQAPMLVSQSDKLKSKLGLAYLKVVGLPASLSLSKLTNPKLDEEEPSSTLQPPALGSFCVPWCVCYSSLLIKAFLHYE